MTEALPLIPALPLDSIGASVDCMAVTRLQLDCRVEILNGAVVLLLCQVDVATGVECKFLLDIIRIEFDRFIVVLNGAIVLALLGIG